MHGSNTAIIAIFLKLNDRFADEYYSDMKRVPDIFDLGASRDYTYIILDELAKTLGVGFRVIAKVNYLDGRGRGLVL